VREIEVSTRIGAAPEQVWRLIADPTRMGEWSPECRRLEWVGSATAPALGARFKGHNRHGLRRWSTTCTITRHEAGRAIAWDVSYLGRPVSNWGYRVEPEATTAGCQVVETFRDRRGRVFAVLASAARGVSDVEEHNRAGMEETLRRIKAAAERS
jgi:uncharacterized protein YndB with AHSA1/START domain